MFYEMDMKPDWKQELFNQERASVLEVNQLSLILRKEPESTLGKWDFVVIAFLSWGKSTTLKYNSLNKVIFEPALSSQGGKNSNLIGN